MKVDRTIVMLFIPPVAGLVICLLAATVLPSSRPYTPEHPEFLTTIDQLSLFTLKGSADPEVKGIRDVFRHEWTMPVLPGIHGITSPADAVPASIQVSMIVEAGEYSYCIVNGKKMRLGDRTDRFRVTSIGDSQVVITLKNGTREILHVKAY